jgi:hypothetical protein
MHDTMDGRHLADEIRHAETMPWFPHRPQGQRRVDVHPNTIRALLKSRLIEEQSAETITGPVRTMHLTERGKDLLATIAL